LLAGIPNHHYLSIFTGLVLFAEKWVLETLSLRLRLAHNMCSQGIAPRRQFQLPRRLALDDGENGNHLQLAPIGKGK
jgi:hypothetical protein